MLKWIPVAALLAALSFPLLAIEQRHGVLVGSVERLDAAAHTVVVKLADGSEHTFHFLKRTAVHGAEAGATGAKDAFRGLKVGSQVAVHYTVKGTDETADEFDNIGKNGLKSTEATITKVDRGAKTLTVRTEDGTEQTYRMADGAAKEASKNAADAAKKSAKVTVYYTEESGHKVVHFFKKTL